MLMWCLTVDTSVPWHTSLWEKYSQSVVMRLLVGLHRLEIDAQQRKQARKVSSFGDVWKAWTTFKSLSLWLSNAWNKVRYKQSEIQFMMEIKYVINCKRHKNQQWHCTQKCQNVRQQCLHCSLYSMLKFKASQSFITERIWCHSPVKLSPSTCRQ